MQNTILIRFKRSLSTRLLGLFLLSMCLSAVASDKVLGSVYSYTSPNKLQERCIVLKRIPGGVYTHTDRQLEKAYCSMDIYSNTGVCPKTWSTSPATMFYPLTGSQYASPGAFEQSICAGQRNAPIKAIAFKNTMNMRDTSATFSTASLLYYHFSRYFNTRVRVPVAVYRSIDKDVHLQRVTHAGIKHTKSHMIHDAWKDMLRVEKDPSVYHPVAELFSADRRQIYGVLVGSEGKRYKAIMNGSRTSSWGKGQSEDFQKTPAFLALRSDKPMASAVAAHAGKYSDEQMVFWMQDLTEITLLDYIFSQQDRIGNIDYTKVWAAALGNAIAITKHAPPESENAQQIKQTHINDNDAGGRYSYANYTKKTKMLERIRHYNPDTYQQLMKLDNDFLHRGEIYDYLNQTFGLTEKQRDMVVKNTRLAAAILRNSCLGNSLQFDLQPAQFFIHGSVEAGRVECDAYSIADKPS